MDVDVYVQSTSGGASTVIALIKKTLEEHGYDAQFLPSQPLHQIDNIDEIIEGTDWEGMKAGRYPPKTVFLHENVL